MFNVIINFGNFYYVHNVSRDKSPLKTRLAKVRIKKKMSEKQNRTVSPCPAFGFSILIFFFPDLFRFDNAKK